MTQKIPSRDEAYELFTRYNKNDSLLRHALSVEAVMRHFAQLLGEDEEKWGVIGLVHDIDYEMYPEEHCQKAREILEENHWPKEYIKAVQSHGWQICSTVEPTEKMEKVLYAIDELTGLITATALMRPSKSLLDLEVKSVKKKWKDKRFAAGVDRDIIQRGIEMTGLERDYVIQETINGMKNVAAEIGLQGE
jgi:putative nucleotidyltransferase with HDIG domain